MDENGNIENQCRIEFLKHSVQLFYFSWIDGSPYGSKSLTYSQFNKLKVNFYQSSKAMNEAWWEKQKEAQCQET